MKTDVFRCGHVLSIILCVSLIIVHGPLWAATFNVTPTSDSDCSDFECDFQSALDAASVNNEEDTVYLASGTYDAPETSFAWSTIEDFPLTIVGSPNTVIDGGSESSGLSIYTSNADPDTNTHITVKGITFYEGSQPAGQGGGLNVMTTHANVTVEDCSFTENTADDGGGAFITSYGSGNILFKNNRLNKNHALNFAGGGAFLISSVGDITVTNNIFVDNDSSSRAGGLYADARHGNITMTNNVFAGNTAISSGGGAELVTDRGIVTLTNNTFYFNLSDAFGGGLGVSLNLNSATLNLFNNILWNNLASLLGNDVYVCDDCTGAVVGAEIILRSNNISDLYNTCDLNSSCAPTITTTKNINGDPLFVDVADSDPNEWDLHISSASPCIDAGDSKATSLPATDMDGDPRILDGDQNGKDLIDIGADEYVPSSFTRLTLIAPNGKESIPAGSPYAIEWNAPPQVEKFTLMYSTDKGQTWVKIQDNVTGTSYPWTVPSFSSNKKNCLIKITGFTGSDTKVGTDVSREPFTIEVLTVTFPNGGEIIYPNSMNTVSWRAFSDATKFDVFVSTDNGKTWEPIGNDVPGTTHPLVILTVPNNKEKCLVKVIGYDDFGVKKGVDVSDGPFEIQVVKLISPIGGETLTSNTSYPILWQDNGTMAPVEEINLFYTLDGGKTWKPIGTSEKKPSLVSWKIPHVEKPKSKCNVKIQLIDAKENIVGVDTSDDFFTILPPP